MKSGFKKSMCLILASVMAASTAFTTSFAIGASADAGSTAYNTPIGVNLFTADLTNPANWTMSNGQTASQIKVSDPDGNGSNTYLRLSGIANSDNYALFIGGGDLTGKLPNSSTYSIKMDVRAQIDGTVRTREDLRYYNFNYTITNSPTTANMFILSAGKDFAQHEITSFTPRYNGYVGIQVRGGNSAEFIAPKNFDNIKIYNSTGTLLHTLTFEKAENTLKYWKDITGGDFNWYWNRNNQDNGYLLDNRPNGAIVTEYDHIRFDANTDTAATLKPTLTSPITLTPGKYELTFDARKSYFFYNEADHVRNVALAIYANKFLSNVKLDGENFDGEFSISDAWDSYKLTFEVNETTTLSSLTFGGTGNAADSDAFDLSRLSLKLVSTSASRPVYSTEDNFLDNAKETYNGAVYTEHDRNPENGFITISQRNWFVNGSDTYAQPNQDIFAVSTGGTYDANYSYYMQFDARNHVPSNGRQNFSVRFCEQISTKPDNKAQILSSGSEWQTFIFSHPSNDTACAGKTLRFRVERSTIWGQTSDPLTFWAGIPVDFDNVIIWKEAVGGDGVYTEADKANVLYSADFNSKDTKYDKDVDSNYWLTGGVLVKTALYSHNFENSFGRIHVSADTVTPVLSYTDLNNGKGHDEGVYAFKAQLRTHYNYVNMRYKPTEIATYNTSNNHKANVTFTMTPTDGGANKTIVRTVDVNYHWSEFSAAITVENGYKLTGIDITPVYNTAFTIPAEARGLDFANVSLGYYSYETIETDDLKNYLDDTTVYTENAVPEQIVVEDTNGYLYVTERTKDTDTVFVMHIDGKLTAGKTYFIEYDIKCEGNGDMEIRPRLTARLAGNRAQADGYFEATSDSGLTTYGASSDGAAEPSWYLSTLTSGTNYHFKGSFVPAGNYNSFDFQFRRGRNAKYTHALTLDNFRIYDENGVDVYNNDFQSETDADLVTKADPANDGYEILHILPVNHTLYTPMDNTVPMSLTYDINLTDEEKVEGKYQFMALAKLAEETDTPAKVCVKFNYSDGSEEILYFDIDNRWSVIGNSGHLDKSPTLETVTIIFETDVPVMINNSALYITYKYQYGRPSTGIVMMLIKKMQGKFVDPWRGLA